MQTILHNILTDLELPYFLLMYTGIGLVGLTAGAVAIWLCDGTRDVDLPDDDDAIDPYQIAFLKGGANRVAQLTIFDLIALGYLERWSPKGFRLFGAPKMVRRITTEFDVSTLSEIQRVAWDWCSRARLLSEVHHRNVGLSKMIANRCDALQAALTTQHYLETSRRQLACKLTKGTLSTALVTLGLYKLVTMAIIGRGESVGLIMLMAIGLLGSTQRSGTPLLDPFGTARSGRRRRRTGLRSTYRPPVTNGPVRHQRTTSCHQPTGQVH
jgi:uncharacterized protein (TIGR04222 family)